MEFTPEQMQLFQIFRPKEFEKAINVEQQNTRFVHYTNANSAMSILKSKEVWLRNATCMNDFMEVRHGLGCLIKVYNSEAGDNFKAAINKLFPGFTAKIEELFNGWMPFIELNSYILCLSEHLNNEDTYGRLSMWRAYGETTGIACVFNNAPFLSSSDALKAYSSPVSYLNDLEFEARFNEVTESIEKNSDFIKERGESEIISCVFNNFKVAALCTKHPGFLEEKEWRVFYTPKLKESEYIKKDIKIINNTPQPIYKIPLKNIPDKNFTGAEIPELIDRIIIGPTQYPGAVREAFEQLLEEAGVNEPSQRVYVSDIPLR